MELVVEVYALTRKAPRTRGFGLVLQMQELLFQYHQTCRGYGREHYLKLIKFLYVSRGSLMELSAKMEISVKLGYLGSQTVRIPVRQSHKLLNGFIFSLRKTVK